MKKKRENDKSKVAKINFAQQAAMLTDKELDLMVENEMQKRKLKKAEKEKSYNANKISKLIYFFFTLQNQGIPVNEIYERDGVKNIKTDRFQEIMGQDGQ